MQQFSARLIWLPLYLLLGAALVYKYRKHAIVLLLAAGALILVSDQTSVAIKKSVKRYRPCYNETIKQELHLLKACGGKYGFVSSHAANTFAIAVFSGLLLSRKRKRFMYLLLIWAAVVSYSRIYLGVHYPLDIIGGAMVGVLLGSTAYILCRNFYIAKQNNL